MTTGEKAGDGGRERGDGVGTLLVRVFEADDEAAVTTLWRDCGLTRPWNDPHRDVARRRAIDDGLFLVGEVRVEEVGVEEVEVEEIGVGRIGSGAAEGGSGTRLVASAMGGYEGHRGWVNYLAVDPAHRGRGHARTLMEALESRLLARGCPKINLQVREENTAALAFYERLGFTVDRSVSLGKRLIPDD